ncbi:helix-turn-helix domain-containing protein [Paenibacillus eucommiae]|uniref:Transcriptional regulator n=1 Tax=Paenibacillus eucommiae TaxID=1355755 RepID=A0ABS4INX8_9BACL|nr:helix-turn-helix transcriptional regulator [Paenibacillus eucommiae]MBP1989218.1 putative transcriptional regulator [Paenibacillus eucommiae]
MKIVARSEVFIKARILKGYSQRDLAKQSGLSHAFISLLERSLKPVGPGTAKKLSDLLDKDLEELFSIEQ